MSLSNFINRLAAATGNVSSTVLNSVNNLLGKTDAQNSATEKTNKSYFADWYGKFMAQIPAAKTNVYRQVFVPQAAKLDFTDNDVKAQLKQEAAKFNFSDEDKNKQSAATSANTNGVNQSNGSRDGTEVFVVGLRKSPLDAGEISDAIIKQLKFTAQDIKDYQAKYGKDPRVDIYNIVNHCLIDPRCKKEGLENFPKPAKSGELLSAPHSVAVENIPRSVTKPLHDFIKTQREQQAAEYTTKRQNLKDNSTALIAHDTSKQIAATVKKNVPELLTTTTVGLGTAADPVLRQPIPLPAVADIAKNMKLVIGGGGALLEAAPPIAAGTALITGALATGKQYLDGQVDNKLDEIATANRERMLAEPLPPLTMTMDDAEPLPQPIPDGKAKERPFAEPIAPTIPNIETAPPPKPGDLVKPETKAKPETTIEDLPQPFTPDAPKGTPPIPQQEPPTNSKDILPPIIGAMTAATGKAAVDALKTENQSAALPPELNKIRANLKDPLAQKSFDQRYAQIQSDAQMADTAKLAKFSGYLESAKQLGNGDLEQGLVKDLQEYTFRRGLNLPYGTENRITFAEFGKQVREGFNKAGVKDAQAYIQGSAITGIKYVNGKIFDVGRKSDWDMAVASPNLFAKAKSIGVEIRGKGTRTEPLTDEQLAELGLFKLKQQLDQTVGRDVGIMIYKTSQDAKERNPNGIYVP